MDNKEKILELFYNKHLKQNEISKIINISNQYVSKIVKADNRYKQEKEYRKKLNKENREIYLKEYFKNYIRHKKDDNSYEQLKAQQRQDAIELSNTIPYISDYAFAKWNRSIYTYDKKSSDIVLKKNICVSIDVPKRVRNVVNPCYVSTTN